MAPERTPRTNEQPQPGHLADNRHLADGCEPGALVVDSCHQRLITGALNHLVKDTTTNDRLGLTLVSLVDVSAAVRLVRERIGAAAAPADPGWTELDQLLAGLRELFRRSFGWVPELGKNRTMNGVQFVTYPNAGGMGGPVPGDAAVARDARRQAGQTAGAGIRVGLADTPIYPHPELTGRYLAARGAILPAEPVAPGWLYVDGHATFIADLILTQAPAAQLDVRPLLAPTGPAHTRSAWEVAGGLLAFLDAGVDLINCSWACYTRDGEPPLVLQRAIGLLTPQVLVVAAAGNHGRPAAVADDRQPAPHFPAWPAALPDVVAVGALDGLAPAGFNPVSVDGQTLAPWIDVLAPGVDVTAAYFGTPLHSVPVRVPLSADSATAPYGLQRFAGTARWSGTSFAAASVAGAIAARMGHCRDARAALAQLLAEPGTPVQAAGQRPLRT